METAEYCPGSHRAFDRAQRRLERLEAQRADHAPAQLHARPQASAPALAEAPGLRALGLDTTRDALLYVPAGYQAATLTPLVLSLHGAGGDAQGGLYPLQPLADGGGFLVLAVPSRGRTWDAVLGAFGPDVAFVDQALSWTFARYAVDPGYVAVAGFSDGASYALSLGLGNGDLFRHVLDLAAELHLRPNQEQVARDLFAAMDQDARRLGQQLVEREQELDHAFAAGTITRAELERRTSEIATLDGQLRDTHLAAHLKMRAVLTPEQVAGYDELRGYGTQAPAPSPQHQPGHHMGAGSGS